MENLIVSAMEIFYALIGGDFGNAATTALSGEGVASAIFGSI